MNVTASVRPRHSRQPARARRSRRRAATSGTASPGSSDVDMRARRRRLRQRRVPGALDRLEIPGGVLDDQRRAHEVARPAAPRSARSLTLNGIVMPGMKPLMSSCLMVISLRVGRRPGSARAARTPARDRSGRQREDEHSTAHARRPAEHRCLKWIMHFTVAVGTAGVKPMAEVLHRAFGPRLRRSGDRPRPDPGMHSAILASHGSPLLACGRFDDPSAQQSARAFRNRRTASERASAAVGPLNARQFWQG